MIANWYQYEITTKTLQRWHFEYLEGIDTIFTKGKVEKLTKKSFQDWRTLKYEHIYLNKYETVSEARIGINKFTHFYNLQRLHSSLEYKTPHEIYYNIITDVKNTRHDLLLV